MPDVPDPVPPRVWDEIVEDYGHDERVMAVLVRLGWLEQRRFEVLPGSSVDD